MPFPRPPRPSSSTTLLSNSTPFSPKDNAKLRRALLVKPASIKKAQILYEDRGLIALNKPPELITQSDATVKERTGKLNAFDAVLEDVRRKLSLEETPYQIHRLDKLTTGILLLAKTKLHARNAIQMFEQRKIGKTYLALVRAPKDKFRFEDGWARLCTDKEKKTGLGQAAETRWEVLGSSDVAPLTLLKLKPVSGVKHQLRVHLAKVMLTPILGDTLQSKTKPHMEVRKLIPWGCSVLPRKTGQVAPGGSRPRMFLPASSVELIRYRQSGPYGLGSVPVKVYAPLPQYFIDVCNAANLTHFIPGQYITGGLVANGERIQEDEVVPGLDARWLGGGKTADVAWVKEEDNSP